MSKRDWANLVVGSHVMTETSVVDTEQEKLAFRKEKITGKVVRFNSNCSQVFVRWDGGSENWYGRLGIEMATPL